MIDQRRLRFSDIVGLERHDLPLACEVWLEDIYRAPWISREAMKLCAYFVRYMNRPDCTALTLREIESQCQLSTDDVRKSLVLLRSFGAVEAFVIDRNDIRVGLCLSYLQRLKALEAKHRFAQLPAGNGPTPWPWLAAEEKWLPGSPAANRVAVALAAVPSPDKNGDSLGLPPHHVSIAPQAENGFDAGL